ncbi:MAG: hypothetical protein KBB11_02750 [Bacteroidales bacterium]|nr:hypothetical protein [Bacteroidales bacterium]HOY39902.1 hypothetical protein [Bacteroidales bacterium]HQP05097.1 hypothetical protein [Bacteroidales bacterium]
MNDIAERRYIVAVDFDGTIVEHKYPSIGKEMPLAFEVLREMQEAGYRLILWTFRDGEYLKDAVEYCLSNGIMFYAVNQSSPNEEFNKYMSRKINADIYIDDRNVGGFPGWEKIREWLLPDSPNINRNNNVKRNNDNKKRGFFRDLFI